MGAVPQTDTDYWLLSDAGVGISDMWRSDRILLNNVGQLVCAILFIRACVSAGLFSPCFV